MPSAVPNVLLIQAARYSILHCCAYYGTPLFRLSTAGTGGVLQRNRRLSLQFQPKLVLQRKHSYLVLHVPPAWQKHWQACNVRVFVFSLCLNKSRVQKYIRDAGQRHIKGIPKRHFYLHFSFHVLKTARARPRLVAAPLCIYSIMLSIAVLPSLLIICGDCSNILIYLCRFPAIVEH